MTLLSDEDDLEHYYYGKYRGKVIKTSDPSKLGRIEVTVIDVLGTSPVWAMPSVPYAGNGVGFFFLPPVGADVWIEFERGDPEYPIWTGCFWGKGNAIPVQASDENTKTLKTDFFSLNVLSGQRKEVSLRADFGTSKKPMPMSMVMNADGISLSNGSQVRIQMKGDRVEVILGDNTKIEVTNGEIKLTASKSFAQVAANQVTAHSASADIKLSGTGVSLTGSGKSVSISADSVSINNDALKVI